MKNCKFLRGIAAGALGSLLVANCYGCGANQNHVQSATYQLTGGNISEENVQKTIAILSKRIETYTAEYEVLQSGEDTIQIEVSGLEDAEELFAWLAEPDDVYFISEKNASGQENYFYDSEKEEYLLSESLEQLEENGSILLTGDEVESATAASQEDLYGNKNWIVDIVLTDDGTEIFAEATEKAAASGCSIGIYFSDNFISVPRVNAAITDGHCIINGLADYESAEEIAVILSSGSLPVELKRLN